MIHRIPARTMKGRLSASRSTFAASATVAILSLLEGCSDADEPGPSGAGTVSDSGAASASDAGGAGALDAAGPKCSVAAGTGSTAGTDAGGGTVPATFETVKLVFGGGGAIMPCSAAPCHGVNGAAPPEHPLELPPTDDQKLYATLLSYVSKACNNTKLVDPCNPAGSALLTILKGPCGVTPRMPYGCSEQTGDCIPEEYVAAVSQWIANGAPRP